MLTLDEKKLPLNCSLFIQIIFLCFMQLKEENSKRAKCRKKYTFIKTQFFINNDVFLSQLKILSVTKSERNIKTTGCNKYEIEQVFINFSSHVLFTLMNQNQRYRRRNTDRKTQRSGKERKRKGI